MAGFAFVLLAFCYVTIDVYKVWSGAPFYFPGKDECFITVTEKIVYCFMKTNLIYKLYE